MKPTRTMIAAALLGAATAGAALAQQAASPQPQTQPDGSQKALEVHIFAESMRGTGEGHRPWDGAPNSTMTNGTVGATVGGVDGVRW